MIGVTSYKVALVVLLAVAASSGTSAYFYQQRTAELNSRNANLEGQVTAYKDQTDNLASQLNALRSQVSELQNQRSQLKTIAVDLLVMDETTISSSSGELGVIVTKYSGTTIPVTFSFAFRPDGEFRSVTRVILLVYHIYGGCEMCDGFSTSLNGASTAKVPITISSALVLSTLEDPSFVTNLKNGANMLELRLSTPNANGQMYVAKITMTVEYQSLL